MLIGISTLVRGNLISPEQRAQLLWQLWAMEMFVQSYVPVPDLVIRRACFPDVGHGVYRNSGEIMQDQQFLPPIRDARLLLRACTEVENM